MTDISSDWTVSNGIDGTFNVSHHGSLVATNVSVEEALAFIDDPRARVRLLGPPQPPETLVSGSSEVVRSGNFSVTKVDTSFGGIRVTVSNFDVAMHLRSKEELEELIETLSRMMDSISS